MMLSSNEIKQPTELQVLSREDFLAVLEAFPHELDRCSRLANTLWPTRPFEGPEVPSLLLLQTSIWLALRILTPSPRV